MECKIVDIRSGNVFIRLLIYVYWCMDLLELYYEENCLCRYDVFLMLCSLCLVLKMKCELCSYLFCNLLLF